MRPHWWEWERSSRVESAGRRAGEVGGADLRIEELVAKRADSPVSRWRRGLVWSRRPGAYEESTTGSDSSIITRSELSSTEDEVGRLSLASFRPVSRFKRI